MQKRRLSVFFVVC